MHRGESSWIKGERIPAYHPVLAVYDTAYKKNKLVVCFLSLIAAVVLQERQREGPEACGKASSQSQAFTQIPPANHILEPITPLCHLNPNLRNQCKGWRGSVCAWSSVHDLEADVRLTFTAHQQRQQGPILSLCLDILNDWTYAKVLQIFVRRVTHQKQSHWWCFFFFFPLNCDIFHHFSISAPGENSQLLRKTHCEFKLTNSTSLLISLKNNWLSNNKTGGPGGGRLAVKVCKLSPQTCLQLVHH